MRRIAEDTQDSQNYDSFLDVVANLVGILVILIMVIGVRARHARQAISHVDSTQANHVTIIDVPSPPRAKIDLAAKQQNIEVLAQAAESAHAETMRIKKDIHHLDGVIQDIEQQAAAQELRRNELQLLVALAETALNQRRDELQAQDKQDLNIAKQWDQSQVELASLEDTINTIKNETGEPKVLEHRPTPMARMVFGHEEHYRLLGGQLSRVPINEMTAILKRDAGNKLWKLKNTDEISETIGPVDGYRMKYTLQRREQVELTPDGPRVHKVIDLQKFVMVPESPSLGEPITAAVTAGSQLAQQLASLSPQESTITVWIYPDSFAAFRQLKSFLAERGFTAAARPLPHGFPIGGSPDGSKSAAE